MLKVFFVLLIVIFKSYALTIQDYMSKNNILKLELITEINYQNWKVYVVNENNIIKTILIDKNHIKQFYGFPEILSEFMLINNYKIFPDGEIEKISYKYPIIIKKKLYGGSLIYLQKNSKYSLDLYIKKGEIRKKIVEFKDIDAFFGKSGVFFSDIKDGVYKLYKLYPSEWIYDVHEFYQKKLEFGYTYKYLLYKDTLAVFIFDNYKQNKAFVLIFDIKNEKIEQLITISNWNPKKDTPLGFLQNKLFVKKEGNIQIITTDNKILSTKIIKLKQKQIKLSKKEIVLPECIDTIYVDENYIIPVPTQSSFILVFDKTLQILKSKPIKTGSMIFVSDKKIYLQDYRCLNQIYPVEKLIKCEQRPFEYIYPTIDEKTLFIYKKPIPPEFLSKGEKGYLIIEKENNLLFRKKLSPKSKKKFIFTSYGALIIDKEKSKVDFLDINANIYANIFDKPIYPLFPYKYLINLDKVFFKIDNKPFVFFPDSLKYKPISYKDIFPSKKSCYTKNYFIKSSNSYIYFYTRKDNRLVDFIKLKNEKNILCLENRFILYESFPCKSKKLEIYRFLE